MTDHEAIAKASTFEHPHAVELWEGDRLVQRFERSFLAD